MPSPFRRLSPCEFSSAIELAELKKIALLSPLLPIWQFKHFYGISRDAGRPYTNARPSSLVGTQKSGQKSTPISLELHNLWWMGAWQEPQFDPLFPIGKLAPKTCYIDSFDEYGWFTEKQWALLANLLPSEPLENTRGRPPASSHAILSAIFWKVAHHFSWDDLRDRFPPKRTCRRYYKRWLLGGRLMTIYKVLLQDLIQRGRAHPFDFVLEGYFEITEDHRIFAIPGKCPDTWQTRLALLLMQETYALLRREEKDNYFPHPPLLKKLGELYARIRLSSSEEVLNDTSEFFKNSEV